MRSWVFLAVVCLGTVPKGRTQDRDPRAVIPSLEVYSEFQRIDPFGNIVSVDKAARPREILSPAIPRRAHASFHVAVTVPPGENFFLLVVPNPLNACGVEMYREHFVQSGDKWIPDTLDELHRLPEFGVMPDPQEHIPGQNTRVYLLDLWIPPDADLSGFRLEVQMKIGTWIVRPMEIRVYPARVPDLPNPGPARLPGIEMSADASATGALTEYLSGRIAPYEEKPLTVRGIIRRNAVQDMTLAVSLDKQRTGPETLKKIQDGIPRDSGAEWYLRLRDFIYKQSFVPQIKTR